MPSSSDRRELEVELNEDADLESPRAGPVGIPRAVADLAGPGSQTSDMSAQQLAIRVAELEARLARASDDGQIDPAGAADTIRDLSERAKILEARLEAARVREDELLGHTIHSDALLADVGNRLALFGQAADRAEALEREHADALARLEAKIAFGAMARRFPGVRLAAGDLDTCDAANVLDRIYEAGAGALADLEADGVAVGIESLSLNAQDFQAVGRQCDGDLAQWDSEEAPQELRQVVGLQSSRVREVLPRASDEAVHRDYFVLS